MTQTQIATSTVSSSGNQEDEQQLVCFRLADEEFGVDINTVREIVRVPEITYIPRAPDYVRGIANLRGNVLPVIDGRLRLFLPEIDSTERTRVLILDIQGTTTGMVVDGVHEVKRIATKDVELPPAVTQGGVDSSFLSGVVKLDNGKRLILTIRPEEVLNIEAKSEEKSGGLLESTKSEKSAEKQEKGDLEELQFVSFVVGDEEYAFAIGVVKEILRLTEITAVPNAPAHVRGLLTVRSVLLPILDLRTMLGLEETEAEDQRVLVVEVNGLTVGLLVDKVNEVLRVPVSVIDDTPKLAAGGQELRSVAQLDDGKRLILILNERGLIDLDEVSTIVGDNNDTKSLVEERSEGTVEEKQMVTFYLGDEEYGFEITQVQEINRLGDVTRLPKSPTFVAGVTNLRGQVVPLINLRQRFNLEDKEADDRTRIIIIELSGHRTGIIVDQVNEVLRMPAKDIETTPSIVNSSQQGESSEFMSGVCKVNNGERMILLMDTVKLLSTHETQALESMAGGTAKQPPPKPKPEKPAGEAPKVAAPSKPPEMVTTPEDDGLEMVIEE